MSNPIPCASSAKPEAKVYDLYQHAKHMNACCTQLRLGHFRELEELSAAALSEWADLATAFSIQKDCLAQSEALHNELLAGCKKIDALLAEIAGWNCQCGPSLEKVRDQLLEHIVLSDPDYIRWTIAAPIPDA